MVIVGVLRPPGGEMSCLKVPWRCEVVSLGLLEMTGGVLRPPGGEVWCHEASWR